MQGYLPARGVRFAEPASLPGLDDDPDAVAAALAEADVYAGGSSRQRGGPTVHAQSPTEPNRI
jgi:hypothetical protein